MTLPQIHLDQLRLRSEFCLIAGEWENVLDCYNEMLQLKQDPFILTAKAKVLEHLNRYPEAMENFEAALQFVAHDEIKTAELLRFILDLQHTQSGLLKTLAQENMRKFDTTILPNHATILEHQSTATPVAEDATATILGYQSTAMTQSDATILEHQSTATPVAEDATILGHQPSPPQLSDATILGYQSTATPVAETATTTILGQKSTAMTQSDATILEHQPLTTKSITVKMATLEHSHLPILQNAMLNTATLEQPYTASATPEPTILERQEITQSDITARRNISKSDIMPDKCENVTPSDLVITPHSDEKFGSQILTIPEQLLSENVTVRSLDSNISRGFTGQETAQILPDRPNITMSSSAQSDDQTKPHVVDVGNNPLTNQEIGRTFGRYQILKKLGEGGMGIVYKVHDPEIGRISALKVLRIQQDNISPIQVQRFMQEVKATARLQHPGIITIFEFSESPQPYFTMEYLDGKTLGRCIQEEVYKAQKAARILKAIAEAIFCAHQSGIIHRDLKPGNIIILQNGTPKVLDFGLAKLEGEVGLSKTGDIMGTPAYMSPEQARGGHADARSDVYSLGAIGYEMITGKPVFQGDNVFQVLQKAMTSDPVRPKSIYANIDNEIETILLKCLEKSPNKRYQTAQELADDLGRYLENRPILAKPPTFANRTWKLIRRNKEKVLAGMALGILLLWGIFYVIANWIVERNLNKVVNMINDVSRWDLEQIDYEKDAEVVFSEAECLAPCYFVYTRWGEFCIRYAQKHPEKKIILYAIAEKLFNKSIQDNENDTAAMYYLMFIYSNTGEIAKMEYFDRKLNQTAEKFQNAHNEFYHLALAKANSNDDQKIEHYKNALRYNPLLFCAYTYLGEVYLRKEQYDIAEEYFNKSLEVSPNYQYALIGRTKLYVAWGKSLGDKKYRKGRDTYSSDVAIKRVQECLSRAKKSLQDASSVSTTEKDFKTVWRELKQSVQDTDHHFEYSYFHEKKERLANKLSCIDNPHTTKFFQPLRQLAYLHIPQPELEVKVAEQPVQPNGPNLGLAASKSNMPVNPPNIQPITQPPPNFPQPPTDIVQPMTQPPPNIQPITQSPLNIIQCLRNMKKPSGADSSQISPEVNGEVNNPLLEEELADNPNTLQKDETDITSPDFKNKIKELEDIENEINKLLENNNK